MIALKKLHGVSEVRYYTKKRCTKLVNTNEEQKIELQRLMVYYELAHILNDILALETPEPKTQHSRRLRIRNELCVMPTVDMEGPV